MLLQLDFFFIQASDEEHAYEIMKELDVDYVLVIFGGLIGYSSDGKIIIFKFFSRENKYLHHYFFFCRH